MCTYADLEPDDSEMNMRIQQQRWDHFTSIGYQASCELTAAIPMDWKHNSLNPTDTGPSVPAAAEYHDMRSMPELSDCLDAFLLDGLEPKL